MRTKRKRCVHGVVCGVCGVSVRVFLCGVVFEYVSCAVCFCGVVWCGVVWCGVVWCGVVWYGMVWYGMVWCVAWRGIVWYGVVWCGGVCVCVCLVWCACLVRYVSVRFWCGMCACV